MWEVKGLQDAVWLSTGRLPDVSQVSLGKANQKEIYVPIYLPTYLPTNLSCFCLTPIYQHVHTYIHTYILTYTHPYDLSKLYLWIVC